MTRSEMIDAIYQLRQEVAQLKAAVERLSADRRKKG